jgi:hypothetical protein
MTGSRAEERRKRGRGGVLASGWRCCHDDRKQSRGKEEKREGGVGV